MSDPSIIIGVATTVTPKLRNTKNGRWRRPAMQYVRIAAAASRLNAQVCLFHPHQVNWSRGRVECWIPENDTRPQQNWVKRSVVLPDVIYENVFVHLAMDGYAVPLRNGASKRGIPLFNPVLPGKWRMVQLLNRAGLRDFTPETERLRDVEQLKSRLHDWDIAYVKPIGGYGGMDVNRVERLGGGRYRISVDRTKTQTAPVRTTMEGRQIQEWVSRRKFRPHLLQRGLNLLTVGERKLDFRVVVHRDVKGDWQLVGIVPKMAATDGVVTNIVAGGQRLDMDALEHLARAEGKNIPTHLLESRAKVIAEQLSKRYPTIGLIGFDMAVEENGKVSMIEMNPKPARSLLSVPMLERLAEHTAGFAVYLARRRGKN